MAYDFTDIVDKAAGDVVTEANWDSLKDNINDLMTPPRAQISMSSADSASTATLSTMNFDDEDEDTDSMVDLGTNDDRITIQRAGWYYVSCRGDWQALGGGTVRACVLQHIPSGGGDIRIASGAPFVSSVTTECGVGQLFECAANDYFRMLAYQDSGSTLTIDAVLNAHWMSKP